MHEDRNFLRLGMIGKRVDLFEPPFTLKYRNLIHRNAILLHNQVSLMVRASPQAGAEEAGKVVGKGSIIMATGLEGDYIR